MTQAVQALDSNANVNWPGAGQYLSPEQAFRLWGPHIQFMSQVTGIAPEILAGMMYTESSGNPLTSTINPGDGHADVGLMQISAERWQSEVLPWAKSHLSPQQQDQLCRAFGVSSLDDITLSPEQLKSNPGLSLVAGALEAMMKLEEVGGSIDKMLSYYNTGNPNSMPADYLKNVHSYASQYLHSGLA